MHYILNTIFVISPVDPRSQKGPTSFSQPVAESTVNQSFKKYFKPGVYYSIKNIKKVPDGIEYHFFSSTYEPVTILFASCSQADQFIAYIKGESLPNYDKFYETSQN